VDKFSGHRYKLNVGFPLWVMRTLFFVKFGLPLLAALKCVWASTCPAENSNLVMDTKRRLLAKLGLSEEPQNPVNLKIPETFLNEVRAMEEVNKLKPSPTPCSVADFVERETTVYTPTETIEYRPKFANLRVPEGAGCTSKFDHFYHFFV